MLSFDFGSVGCLWLRPYIDDTRRTAGDSSRESMHTPRSGKDQASAIIRVVLSILGELLICVVCLCQERAVHRSPTDPTVALAEGVGSEVAVANSCLC